MGAAPPRPLRLSKPLPTPGEAPMLQRCDHLTGPPQPMSSEAVCPTVQGWHHPCSWGACRLGLRSRRQPEDKAMETNSIHLERPQPSCPAGAWHGQGASRSILDKVGNHRCSARL